MRLHLGSFVAGAVVALAVVKVFEEGLPQIKICASACCGDEDDLESQTTPTAEESPVSEEEVAAVTDAEMA